MHPVAPRTGAEEISIGRDQIEFKELTGAAYQDENDQLVVCTRWKFTEAEKEAIMRGEDLYILHHVGEGSFQPIHLQVGTDGPVDLRRDGEEETT